VRADFRFAFVDVRESTPRSVGLGAGRLNSSGGGDPGFTADGDGDGGFLVEVIIPGTNAAAVVHRLRNPTTARDTATLPLVGAGPCPEDGDAGEICRVLSAAVASDGTSVVLLRRDAEDLMVERCALTLGATSTASNCEQVAVIAHEAAATLAPDDVRLSFDGDAIVGAAPGLIFGVVGGDVSRVDIDGFTPRADVRLIGDCIVTASSRRTFFVPIDNPDNFADLTVDGEVRSVLGVGADADAFVYAAGGAESIAGTVAAAQLYRIPLDGCDPRANEVQIPGGLRGQADIVGVGVDADGGIFVGDAAEAVWQVLPTQAASGN
jgi:hypothetical protein